jgi:hypothetical protein
MNNEFAKYWDSELKPFIIESFKDPLELLKSGSLALNNEDYEKAKSIKEEMIKKGYHIETINLISYLLWRVEHDLCDDRNVYIIYLHQLKDGIEDKDFLKNCFNGNETDQSKKCLELNEKINIGLKMV